MVKRTSSDTSNAKGRANKKVTDNPSAPNASPRHVTPDSIDFRDRKYSPMIDRAPEPQWLPPPATHRPILHQKKTDACTGFALATVIHVLTSRRDKAPAKIVAPFMLYGMARRYDNLPGANPANGSTTRGVLKGWFKHGACEERYWPALAEPGLGRPGKPTWWDDGVMRPLGAYYRVEPQSVVDMQIALNETGVLLASADTHDGWDKGDALPLSKRKPLWSIPYVRGASGGGGHAFAIVGYTSCGFIVQNSWGNGWGSQGLAILSYDDWIANGWDCWASQLGVVTENHHAAALGGISRHRTLGSTRAGMLDIHALSPYIVNTGNDGKLSSSGVFHTRPEDIDEMISVLMPAHRAEWGIPASQPLDVALYAHGGLVDESAAAQTASQWIPLLKQHHVFPIFFMWESGLIETILNEIRDWFRGRGEMPTGGRLSGLDSFWSDRIEGVARLVGKSRWSEMKENARMMTTNPQGGARLVAQRLLPMQGNIRLHLIGHSAGAIIHAYLADKLVQDGWNIESLSLMAPAARVCLFNKTYLPHLQNQSIKRMAQFHLNDDCEDDENGMRIALGYKRSLLYMISNGLEEQRKIPVLGMQKYFDSDVAPLALPNMQSRIAPGSPATGSTKHGAFDDDPKTQQSVIAHVLGNAIP